MNSRLDCEGSEGIEKEQSIRLPTSSFPPRRPCWRHCLRLIPPLQYISISISILIENKERERSRCCLGSRSQFFPFPSLYSTPFPLLCRGGEGGTELYTLSFSLLLSLLVRDRRILFLFFLALFFFASDCLSLFVRLLCSTKSRDVNISFFLSRCC